MRVKLFGKLPPHGDFVMRGMTIEAREALDAWLSEGLAAAREALGAGFEDLYDRAPPWRFMAPDVGVAGVLVASVDRARRRYPVWLALEGAASEDAAEQCEALLYTGFAQGWDADRLVAEAGALAPAPASHAAEARWWTLGGEGFAPAHLSGARPPALFQAMLMPEAQS